MATLPNMGVDLAYKGRKFHLEGISDQDHLMERIAHYGTFYEIDLLTYIESLTDVFAGGVAVDVGANIGNHAIFLAEFVRSPLIAFEPNPTVLPLLKSNLKRNNVHVELIEKGLGASESHGTMEVLNEQNLGNARIIEGGDIDITTLDHACKDVDVALIKVDVEGMELQVLEGAVETLERCRPHLFLEADTKQHLRALKEFLKPLGYEPLVYWADTPVWHFAHQPSLKLKLRTKGRRATWWPRFIAAEIRGRRQ